MSLRLLVVAGLIAALAFAGLVAGYVSRDRDGGVASAGVVAEETGFRGSRIAPGVRAPDFELRDEKGDSFTMRELRGRPVVVTFWYSTCGPTCSAAAQQIRGALDQLGHDVPVVTISVDPGEDTGARARRFLVEERMTGRLRFGFGSGAELARLLKAYGTARRAIKQEDDLRAVLVDGRGRQRVGFGMNATSPEMIAHDLAVLERE